MIVLVPTTAAFVSHSFRSSFFLYKKLILENTTSLEVGVFWTKHYLISVVMMYKAQSDGHCLLCSPSTSKFTWSFLTFGFRFSRWTLTDTMVTPCLILEVPTAHVMRLAVWDRSNHLHIHLPWWTCPRFITSLFWFLNKFSDDQSGAWSNWKD